MSGKLYYISANNLTNARFISIPDANVSILSMALLHKDTTGELKADAAYFGTTNGVYYKKQNEGTLIKVPGLDEAIQDVQIDYGGSVFAITEINKNISKKSPGWFSNNDNTSSQNKDFKTCLAISNENPYFDATNDYFKIRLHGGAAHNGLEVKVSLKTAIIIEKMYFEKNKKEFKDYLINLFKVVKLYNEGWSAVSYTDYDNLADILYGGFNFFHEEIIKLKRENSKNKSIFIETRRTWYWENLLIYFYKGGRQDIKGKFIYSSTNSLNKFD